MQDYLKPGELDPLPEGAASLYKFPWRSNVRTVSAYQALQGVGVYYKHVPAEWTEAFDRCSDDEVPSECAGRAISFYSAWSGTTTKGWLSNTLYDEPRGPNDVCHSVIH